MLNKIWNNRAVSELRSRNEQSTQGKKETSIGMRAKVTRADGYVEPDRIICYAHVNPVIHFFGAPLAYFNGWFWNRYYTARNNRRLQS